MESPICCLDITSSSIKLLVGYMINKQLYILDALESSIAHLENGHVQDKNAMVQAINELVKTSSERLKIQIKDVVVGLYPYHFKREYKQDSTSVTSSEREIQYYDAKNLISKIINSNPYKDLAICDIAPDDFTLDEFKTSKNFPVGQRSNNLGIRGYLFYVDKSYYDEIIDVINKCNLKVKLTCLIPNACYKYIYSFMNNNSVNDFIHLDYQEEQTFVSFSNKGNYVDSSILNYGLEKVINDLIAKLNIDRKTAIEYKNYYGLEKGPNFDFKTKQGYSIDQINKVIKDSLLNLSQDLYGIVMSLAPEVRTNIIFSGEGSSIKGIEEFLKDETHCRINTFTPITYGARNSAYTNLVSILYYYCTYEIKAPVEQKSFTFTRTDTNLNIKKINEANKETKEEIL